MENFTLFLTNIALLVAIIIVGGIALPVVWRMWTGRINLDHLVSEEDGKASLSRFQMLLFTYVVASIYLVYALFSLAKGGSGATLPEIPLNVLGLIGISGGSYILSKGIQVAGEDDPVAQPPPAEKKQPPKTGG